MKITARVTVASLLLWGLAASPAALAQTCDDIVFGSAVTDKLPNAAEGCQEVVERDGKMYAKFVAEVVRVRGRSVTVDLMKRDGGKIRQTFRPDPRFRVNIGGQPTRIADLHRGQEIRIYLPADRWEVVHVPEAPTEPVVVAALLMPEPEPEVAMPTTASPLPLIGLLGVGFVFLGGGLTAVRRLYGRK